MDESGTHDGSPGMCVAGYIFRKDAALAFNEELAAVLQFHRLPFFHMVDCAHGAEHFAGRAKDECIEVEKKVIALVKKHSERGFAAGIIEAEYNQTSLEEKHGLTAYAFCWRYCLDLIRAWADAEATKDDIAYFMEAGHRDQSVVEKFFRDLASKPKARRRFRYVAHTFADKEKVLPLQAADLLAWQTFTFIRRGLGGNGVRRADLDALVRPQDVFSFPRTASMKDLERRMERPG